MYSIHIIFFQVYEKPVFTATLAGPAQIMEGQSAHYECRVVPVGDPNMRYEWYCNGVELKMGEYKSKSRGEISSLTSMVSLLPRASHCNYAFSLRKKI